MDIGLLKEAIKEIGMAPTTTKIIYVKGGDYPKFLSDNEKDDSIAVLFSYAMCNISGVNFLPPASAKPAKTVTTSAEIQTATLKAAKRWVPGLVACTQVSELSEANITNYFKSKGTETQPWLCLEILRYIASRTTKLSEAEGYTALMEAEMFFGYHTRASAAPKLMETALDNVPFSGIFNAEDMRAYENAKLDMTDIERARKMTSRSIILTAIILEACNAYPPTWYMGNKAKAAFAPAKYAALLTVMKRAYKVQAGTEGIDTVASIDELKSMFMEKLAITGEVTVETMPDLIPATILKGKGA